MPETEHIPTFAPEGAPISLLIDYDGTISRLDVGDTLLERLAVDQTEVAPRMPSTTRARWARAKLLGWDMDVLPQDRELLLAIATAVPQDETLRLLVECARAEGAAVEIVSDGLGFYIPDNLARLGLADLPVATNHTTVPGGGAGMRFPYGNPRCFVCGTCKRGRVFLHQAAGRIVVFIGDGTSDRYAAAHADVVFAKGRLIDICRAEGWAAMTWATFAEIAAWLEAGLSDGTLPRTSAEVQAWRKRRPARPFICGPEAWGDGRTTPPLQGRAVVG